MDLRRHGGIYRIRNTITGGIYVGSARVFHRRFMGHLQTLRKGTATPRLQHAWNKYGESAFVFEPLFVCSANNLIAYEQAFIDFYAASDRAVGYNILATAGSRQGLVHSQATRDRISAANKGRPKSPEHRAKIAAAKIGVKRQQEFCQKLSAVKLGVPSLKLRGRQKSAESIAKQSAAMTGRTLTNEHRNKISTGLTGNKNSLGHVASNEHKARISASLRAAYASGRRQRLQPGRKRVA